VNILDENIPDSQRQLLRSWRIQISQIGHEVDLQGMKDEEIIPLLHQIRGVTFLTRDIGFYHRRLCHADYCLVCLAVSQYEVASFVRRFLRHSAFNTKSKRMGKVIKVTHTGLRTWQLHADKEMDTPWVP
jgi:hypothetical protein